ncbi:MAG: AraC family transcriptional regulator [Chitinophagaceae bacterium]
MKLLIEKLPLSENTSFVARTYRTPHFEVPWHQHIECELILFTQGKGTAFVGNYIGEFEPGDVYFLGADLPHTFQPGKGIKTSAVVVQFREDFWGTDFLELPENKNTRKLFNKAARGLKLYGKCKQQLNSLIKELEDAEGLQRIICLCNCLQTISLSNQYNLISTQEIKQLNAKHKERIDAVFQYTIENFQEPIQLSTVARTAGLSVPAFCNYFKKSTKKTYIDFLNEIRIGHACKLLNDTQKAVMDVCYESGFNTLANFNKQFLKQKKTTPSGFRKALNAAK